LIIQKNGCNNRIITILIFFVFLLPCALLAQEELYFVAERDTVAYRDEDGNRLEILAGEIINTDAAVLYGQVHIGSDLHLVIRFGDLDIHWVFAKHFRPANTEDVFSNNIFIDYPVDSIARYSHASGFSLPIAIGDVDEMWVPYYYTDILMGQTRDRLLDIRPGLAHFHESNFGDPILWHEFERADIQNGRAMFYNSVIKLGIGTNFAVRNIRKTDFGYIVDCVVSTLDARRPWEFVAALAGSEFWDIYHPGDAVTLLLHIDGDYLDIYTVGTNIHVGTFIRVGREFQTQYQSLIRTNTADLTNVQWPSRAEGSTGIPPVFVVPDNFRNESLIEDQENVFVQQNDDVSSLPLWFWFAIIGGVVLIGVVVLAIVKRKR
jgi:hypothetical protein